MTAPAANPAGARFRRDQHGAQAGKPQERRRRRRTTPDTQGKRVSFDQETWQSLDLLARDRMMTFQELADEAFLDVLRKHGRPYDTATRSSAARALAQANDNPAKAKKPAPKSKRPAGGRRARS